MNKFVKTILDCLFDIKIEYLAKNICYYAIFLFVSLFFTFGLAILIEGNTTGVDLLILVVLLSSFVIYMAWACMNKFDRYFLLSGFIVLTGTILSNSNLIRIGGYIGTVGLIMNALYIVGDIIEETKKKRRKK